MLLGPEMPMVKWGKLDVPTGTLQKPFSPVFLQALRGRGSGSSGILRTCRPPRSKGNRLTMSGALRRFMDPRSCRPWWCRVRSR